jgi:hypothetical protein
MLINAKSPDQMILMHAIVHLIERHVTERLMRLLGERPHLLAGRYVPSFPNQTCWLRAIFDRTES